MLRKAPHNLVERTCELLTIHVIAHMLFQLGRIPRRSVSTRMASDRVGQDRTRPPSSERARPPGFHRLDRVRTSLLPPLPHVFMGDCETRKVAALPQLTHAPWIRSGDAPLTGGGPARQVRRQQKRGEIPPAPLTDRAVTRCQLSHEAWHDASCRRTRRLSACAGTCAPRPYGHILAGRATRVPHPDGQHWCRADNHGQPHTRGDRTSSALPA
jgi:hypothetical protein